MHAAFDKATRYHLCFFFIVTEVLNSLIREADRRGTLSPLPGQAIRHRASLYADDLFILTVPSTVDLQCLLEVLWLFAGASGLVTNVDKCVATPIWCSEEVMQAVQLVFPCVVTPFLVSIWACRNRSNVSNTPMSNH
jgi:hypothetical protein